MCSIILQQIPLKWVKSCPCKVSFCDFTSQIDFNLSKRYFHSLSCQCMASTSRIGYDSTYCCATDGCTSPWFSTFNLMERVLEHVFACIPSVCCRGLGPAGNKAPHSRSLTPPQRDRKEKIQQKACRSRQGQGRITHQLWSQTKNRLDLGGRERKSI